jgi:hypothetical protein
MKVVSISPVKSAPEAAAELRRGFQKALDAFYDAYPELPVCIVVGVLEMLKYDVITSVPTTDADEGK